MERPGTRSKRRSRPLIIGVTGNFGTGKTMVSRLFKERGAKVLDADRLAHEVFRRGNPVYARIHSLFRDERGKLTRAKIARIVFRNPMKRRKLESLIHPYVFRRIREETAQVKGRCVVIEVPLLFETGFHRRCDRTIVVKAQAGEVLRRLRRKGYSRAEIRDRWRAQMPLGEKIRRADYVIDNSDSRARTRLQAERIWRKEFNQIW